MRTETKQVQEFGQDVTLWRCVGPDGWTTLWHSTREKAVAAYDRHVERGA